MNILRYWPDRVISEENMAPLVFDIDEGGHHDHNQEDDDHENNHLGEEMMVKGSTSPLDKPARLSVC